jgi:hypothetical protein
MGLKINLVIVEGRPTCSELELVESLGFKNICFHQQVPLENYIDPAEGFIAIAFWNNFTVIAHDTLPISMINLDFSKKRYFNEVTLRRFFDTTNSLSVLLHSVTNTYGMCLIKGKRYSVIYGHSGGFQMTRGERTQIELDYLENSSINSMGETIYKVDGDDLTHDQIGEDIILWNIEHFTGKPSGELFDLPAQVFKVTDDHLVNYS